MDHIADLNLTTFHRLNQQHVLPEFVKTAQIDRDAVAHLPNSSFADPVHREFPCHTRADTFLSYAYFTKHASDVDRRIRAIVYDRLEKFASDWAILLECKQLERDHVKQASSDPDKFPDDDFAIVETFRGEKYRALPLLNPECVKAAADHLFEYRDRYPLKWRKAAATRIAERAADMEIELPDRPGEYISKASGVRSTCLPVLAMGVLDRARLVARENRATDEYMAMGKIAQVVTSMDPTLANISRVTSVIDSFDSRFGLKECYARGLPSPEELVYNGATVKDAQDLKDNIIVLTNGSQYTKSALTRVGVEPYRALGDDFVAAITEGLDLSHEKLASIIPTLPRGDADTLDRALRAVGVKKAFDELNEAGIPASVSEWTGDDWTKANQLAAA